jgi:hypothetical protein
MNKIFLYYTFEKYSMATEIAFDKEAIAMKMHQDKVAYTDKLSCHLIL